MRGGRGALLAQVLRRAFGKLQLPGAAIVRWLDEHVQLRLSILLGWLFGRSVFFMQLLRWLGSMARYGRLVAQPAVELLGKAAALPDSLPSCSFSPLHLFSPTREV